MKTLSRLGLTVLLILAAAGSAPAAPQEESGNGPVRLWKDQISIFGDEIYIPADTAVRASVLCIGGKVVIEGQVSQDVVVIMGSLELRGEVRGNVVGVLSDMELDGATVGDVLVNAAGKLVTQDSKIDKEFNFGLGSWFPGFQNLFLWYRTLKLLVVFVMLVLLVALMPERIRVVAEEAPVRYLSAFFVGILGYLAFWTIFILLTATVVGAPAAWLLFQVFKWMCIAGIFFAVGRGLGRALGREISLLGGVLLVFAVYALVSLAPIPLGLPGFAATWIFGLFFLLMVKVPAVGLLILTRAGSRGNSAAASPASPVPPPAPPAAPAPPGTEPAERSPSDPSAEKST